MIKDIGIHTARFILFVLLQVLIFNSIQFSGYINPYVYILFIIWLPFDVSKVFLLFIAFFLGLCIDIFPQGIGGHASTLGIHAAATVFMAYLRPYILNMIAPRDGYETGTSPKMEYYGFLWFLKYVFIIVFAHHFLLFFLENLSFTHFWHLLIKLLLSTFSSTLLIILMQFLSYRRK